MKKNETYTNYPKLKRIGDEGEQIYYQWMVDNGFSDIIHVDEEINRTRTVDKSDWDLKATDAFGVTATFEVKNQQDCHHHGTVNVEQVQNGKPAGIATTKSDYFVFVNSTLGIGFEETANLKNLHRQIVGYQPRLKKVDYKNKETIKVSHKQGEDRLQLWMTGFKNYACGFKYKNEWLDWK